MNKARIISLFSLKNFGQKGFMKGQLFCPECGKNDKFGVIFLDKGAVTHCFYCSVSIPLWKILKDLGHTDLLDHEYEYVEGSTLPYLNTEKVELEKSVELPIGFRRINDLTYLRDRNFTKDQYEQFKVGIASLDPRTENKVIFLIYQKNKLAGWLARSKETKEWHHENLRRHKEFKEPLVLRYRNSNNDFSKMLGGLDEITENTHTLILVEGLFDKANLDRLMGLNDLEEIKCCYTFGSDLSIDQVDLIPSTVERVILLYDKDTIISLKKAGERLISLFEVKVALIEDKDIDPGNMNQNYLSKIFLNLQDFIYFYGTLSHEKL